MSDATLDPTAKTSFVHRRRVEFHETDAAGIVNFANMLRYCEATEAAFMRTLGTRLHHDDARWLWPRGEVWCRYIAPAFFDDELEIRLEVTHRGQRSLRYGFAIGALRDGMRHELAEAKMAVICAIFDPVKGRLAARPLPSELDAIKETA